MRSLLLALATALAVASCTPLAENTMDRLNAQASKEYLSTIRCNQKNGPFWNAFADKFIYAPAFDFPEAPGARSYRYSIRFIDDLYRTPIPSHDYTNGKSPLPTLDELIVLFKENEGKPEWSFTSDSPKASLSPVWNDITVGNVVLRVDALDDGGNLLKTVGAKAFLRDFPFSGPYYGKARSYREAAVQALIYAHSRSFVRYFLDHDVPDPSYRQSGYVCKTTSAIIKGEVMLSTLVPSLKQECLAIARRAADFMISAAQAPGTPLEYFPPTYYKEYNPISIEYTGLTMGMEAAVAAWAYLDLFDATNERKYFDQALGIASTYSRIQGADGSVPIKMNIETAEAVNEIKATAYDLMDLYNRLENQYKVDTFHESLVKAERYLFDHALDSFDLTGQFEDVDVLGLEPFQNLCNATYGNYARYLYTREGSTEKERNLAKEMLSLVEDQFVHWDVLKDASGLKEGTTPCVYEQYRYRTPIDASVATVGSAFLSEYLATGDELALAKVTALADALTRAQDPRTGLINTYFRYNPTAGLNDFWINCNLASVKLLLRMSELDSDSAPLAGM